MTVTPQWLPRKLALQRAIPPIPTRIGLLGCTIYYYLLRLPRRLPAIALLCTTALCGSSRHRLLTPKGFRRPRCAQTRSTLLHLSYLTTPGEGHTTEQRRSFYLLSPTTLFSQPREGLYDKWSVYHQRLVTPPLLVCVRRAYMPYLLSRFVSFLCLGSAHVYALQSSSLITSSSSFVAPLRWDGLSHLYIPHKRLVIQSVLYTH